MPSGETPWRFAKSMEARWHGKGAVVGAELEAGWAFMEADGLRA